MNELQTGIGTQEAVTLKPLAVIIKEITIEEVGDKKAKKIVCTCEHPDSDNPIKISQIKWENKGKLEVTGLWFNKDSEGLIRKGSALAVFLSQMNAKNPSELVNKTCNTILDEKGYLSFKGY